MPLEDVYNTRCNIWINANAGSGKTTVLINRILALILDKNDVSSILCLTYTKNAAQEIYDRLVNIAKKWHHATKDQLLSDIKNIVSAPNHEHFVIAKKLLSQLLLEANSIDISTIHAFCQRVMQNYYTSSNAPSHKTLNIMNAWHLTKIKRDIMQQLLHLIETQLTKEEYLTCCLQIFIKHYNVHKLQSIIESVIHGQLPSLSNNDLSELLDVSRYANYYAVSQGFIDQINLNTLYDISQLMLQGPQNLVERGQKILWWLRLSKDLQIEYVNVLLQGLLNKDMLPLSRFPSKASSLQNPETAASYQHIAMLASDLANQLLDTILYQTSFILPYLIDNIQHLYIRAKQSLNVVDFQELLTTTREILNQPENLWLLQKIDSKTHHVLIDEAQDTNPLSWDIIIKITEDFFSGHGAHENERTIFVVGDEKQSIFSFQGANLEFFLRMKEYFSQLSQQVSIPFITTNMATSYRSRHRILEVIDQTFNDNELTSCITKQSAIKHNAMPTNTEGGIVKTISVKQNLKIDEDLDTAPSWLPSGTKNITVLDLLLNDTLALVRSLLDDGNSADDIMIILRNREGRKNFSFQLVEALQQRDIKTAGIDKFKLTNHLAYRDILSLYQFIATPDYDLNTACLLHSPIIGLTLDTITEPCLQAKNLRIPLWHLVATQAPKETYQLSEALRQYQEAGKTDAILEMLLTTSLTKKYHMTHGHSGVAVLHTVTETIAAAAHLNIYQLIDYLTNMDLTLVNNVAPGNGIRVMTAHAAKGLESKIIILVDTETDIARSVNMKKLHVAIINDDNALLVPKSELRSQRCKSILSKFKALEFAEEMRLLYVAMSRAREQLYIVGYDNENKEKYNWINIVKL